MENPKLFIGISLVPTILSFLIAFIEPQEGEVDVSVFRWGIFAFFTVILVVINILMGVALIYATADRTLTVKGAYVKAKAKFFSYILLSILLSLILLVGYMLLIIPGIIFTVWYSFAIFALVLDQGGVVASLKQSKAYVKGKWWKVFGRLTGLMVFSMIYGIAIGVLSVTLSSFLPVWLTTAIVLAFNLVLTPVTMAYMYSLYMDIKGSGEIAMDSSTSEPAASSQSTQPSPNPAI